MRNSTKIKLLQKDILEYASRLDGMNILLVEHNTEIGRLRNQLSDLKCKLNNPPLYKKGDIINGFIITNIELSHSPYTKPENWYSYFLTNLKSGDTIHLLETQLTELKNSKPCKTQKK